MGVVSGYGQVNFEPRDISQTSTQPGQSKSASLKAPLTINVTSQGGNFTS